MHHQAQNGFYGIFVGIPQHPKGCLLYVPSKRKIIYSYDLVYDESYPSTLAYTSQPYEEAIDMCQAVSYTPYVTSSKEKTGNIITFAQFEEGELLSETQNLLSLTCDDAESVNKSDDNETMPPFIRKE